MLVNLSRYFLTFDNIIIYVKWSTRYFTRPASLRHVTSPKRHYAYNYSFIVNMVLILFNFDWPVSRGTFWPATYISHLHFLPAGRLFLSYSKYWVKYDLRICFSILYNAKRWYIPKRNIYFAQIQHYRGYPNTYPNWAPKLGTQPFHPSPK